MKINDMFLLFGPDHIHVIIEGIDHEINTKGQIVDIFATTYPNSKTHGKLVRHANVGPK